ncbi:MAG: hypothetical protein ABJA80_14400 [bacterium]
MKTRNFVLSALGLAAAMTFGGAETASAQAKSQTRIPVRKDQPAEPAHADTITVTRVDTVTLRGRTDTVTVRMRPDTVMQMQMLPIQRLPGTYFGLGAGVAIPMNDWRNSTKDGPAVQAQLGWFPENGALGIRLAGVADFFGSRKTDCPACPSPKLYEGNADLMLRFPLDRTSHLNPVITVIGGAGLDKFSDFIPYLAHGKVVTAGKNTYLNEPGFVMTQATAGDKSLFYNYNVGAGLDVNLIGLHWYVESKYTTINTTGGSSHYWPTILGLKFY